MLLHIFHATKSSMQESFSIPLRSSHWCPCIDYLDIKNYSFQGLPLYNEPEAQLQFQCFMFWGATVMPVTTWGHTNTKINTTWAARHRWHGTWWWPLWKVAGFLPQPLAVPPSDWSINLEIQQVTVQRLGGTASTITKFRVILSISSFHSSNICSTEGTVICLAGILVLHRYAGSQEDQEAAPDALSSFGHSVLPFLLTNT